MNDPTMSRREWFRLIKPRPEAKSAANIPSDSIGESSEGMRPIEHPVNHDGMDLSALPPMREALMSDDDVRQLFSDIAALGSQILLMQRLKSSSTASASRISTTDQLETARDSLLSGAIPRVQIRYRWQQQDWIDTLHRREAAFHLVRIVHNPKPPA